MSLLRETTPAYTAVCDAVRLAGSQQDGPARRTFTVGRDGVLTIEQARKLAKAARGAVANGEDPGAKHVAKRGELLVSQLRDLYEKSGCIIQRGKRVGEPIKALTRQYSLAQIDHHIAS